MAVMPEAPGPVRTGVVKWFSEEKGWGYLAPDDGGPEVRVDRAVADTGDFRTLLEGLRVEFTAVDAADGPVATAARVI